jgi:phosphoserine phosphatase RsbU/P
MADTLTQRTERFDLRALYESSRLLSSSLELDFVLNNLLLTAMSKLLVMRGAVLLYDPVLGRYRAGAVKGITGLKRDEMLALPPLATDHLLRLGEIPEALAQHRIELVMPVSFAHREIGLIALGGKATGQPYEPRELEFIQSLVNMSSAAIHNSLMVEELKQANRDLDAKIQQLNTLFDLSQEFNATIDRKRLVKLLSFALMGQMLVGKFVFLLRHDEPADAPEGDYGEAFRLVTSRGIGEARLEASLVARLCKLKELLLLQDGTEDAPEWSGLRNLGLCLVLPLRQHGETCGVLCLGPKMTGQPYGQDDVEFLYALGNLAFVSIQNTYLVEEQIEKERLEEEMRLAREIQERLLPKEVPSIPGVDVASLAIPSRQVGGDYFDVIRLEGRRLLLAIADVTGKGVPASLLMANLQACLRVMIPMPLTIEEATAHINRVICENTSYDKFITYFHGIYHEEDRVLHYVNAGHNPPLLIRADGTLERLETGGLLLGVLKDMNYQRGVTHLAPGDVLVMYTDGVTEAMNVDGDEYGEERLEELALSRRTGTARQLIDAVYADLRAFSGNPAFMSDDLTMIVAKGA